MTVEWWLDLFHDDRPTARYKSATRTGAVVDRFSFFFAFYGLILGLAVTELLTGLGNVVRAGTLKRLGAQTALLALFTLLLICATWIDAWLSLKDVQLDFAGLWAPITIAILYFLSATIVFPRNPAEWTTLDDYYAEKKRFVLGLMLAAEFVVNYSFRSVFIANWQHNPAMFWKEMVYNTLIKLVLVFAIFAKGKRWNVAALVALIAIFVGIYWV
jgi:hypothetical protein